MTGEQHADGGTIPTVQLIDSSGGTVVWAGSFDRVRAEDDLAATTESIAMRVAPVLAQLLTECQVVPEDVADVVIGNAVGGGGNVARLALLDHERAVTPDRAIQFGQHRRVAADEVLVDVGLVVLGIVLEAELELRERALRVALLQEETRRVVGERDRRRQQQRDGEHHRDGGQRRTGGDAPLDEVEVSVLGNRVVEAIDTIVELPPEVVDDPLAGPPLTEPEAIRQFDFASFSTVEAGAKLLPEDVMAEAILFGHRSLQPLIDIQEQIREAVGKPKRVPYIEPPTDARK